MSKVIYIKTEEKELPRSCFDCPIEYDGIGCPLAGSFYKTIDGQRVCLIAMYPDYDEEERLTKSPRLENCPMVEMEVE